MNRKERRSLRHEQHAYVAALPERLTPVPRDEWPPAIRLPMAVWRSRDFLAQIYDEASAAYPGLVRLSVNRTRLGEGSRWQDGMTWDDLQKIKREVGYGDWYGVEVYPRDTDVVNVANLRHLWLMPFPLQIGWTTATVKP